MVDEPMREALAPLMAASHQHEQTLRGYYRSKLFSLQDGLSPFVSAAGPIFSLMDRFSMAKQLPPLERVMVHLEHELKAFQSRLLSMEVSPFHQAMAYYLLSATVDELLVRHYLRLYGRAPVFKAFTPVTLDSEQHPVNFFSILALLQSQPYEYLSLLELAYYCLMAGYEGEFHGRADARLVLESRIDEIFHLIMSIRQPQDLPWLSSASPVIPTETSYRAVAWMGGALMIVVWICFYASQYFLDEKANQLRFAPSFVTHLDE
jgi:type VI secretion system protein ImpK